MVAMDVAWNEVVMFAFSFAVAIASAAVLMVASHRTVALGPHGNYLRLEPWLRPSDTVEAADWLDGDTTEGEESEDEEWSSFDDLADGEHGRTLSDLLLVRDREVHHGGYLVSRRAGEGLCELNLPARGYMVRRVRGREYCGERRSG